MHIDALCHSYPQQPAIDCHSLRNGLLRRDRLKTGNSKAPRTRARRDTSSTLSTADLARFGFRDSRWSIWSIWYDRYDMIDMIDMIADCFIPSEIFWWSFGQAEQELWAGTKRPKFLCQWWNCAELLGTSWIILAPYLSLGSLGRVTCLRLLNSFELDYQVITKWYHWLQCCSSFVSLWLFALLVCMFWLKPVSCFAYASSVGSPWLALFKAGHLHSHKFHISCGKAMVALPQLDLSLS